MTTVAKRFASWTKIRENPQVTEADVAAGESGRPGPAPSGKKGEGHGATVRHPDSCGGAGKSGRRLAVGKGFVLGAERLRVGGVWFKFKFKFKFKLVTLLERPSFATKPLGCAAAEGRLLQGFLLGDWVLVGATS